MEGTVKTKITKNTKKQSAHAYKNGMNSKTVCLEPYLKTSSMYNKQGCDCCWIGLYIPIGFPSKVGCGDTRT